MKIIRRVVQMDMYEPTFLERIGLYFCELHHEESDIGFITYKVLFSTMYIYAMGRYSQEYVDNVEFNGPAAEPWNN